MQVGRLGASCCFLRFLLSFGRNEWESFANLENAFVQAFLGDIFLCALLVRFCVSSLEGGTSLLAFGSLRDLCGYSGDSGYAGFFGSGDGFAGRGDACLFPGTEGCLPGKIFSKAHADRAQGSTRQLEILPKCFEYAGWKTFSCGCRNHSNFGELPWKRIGFFSRLWRFLPWPSLAAIRKWSSKSAFPLWRQPSRNTTG